MILIIEPEIHSIWTNDLKFWIQFKIQFISSCICNNNAIQYFHSNETKFSQSQIILSMSWSLLVVHKSIESQSYCMLVQPWTPYGIKVWCYWEHLEKLEEHNGNVIGNLFPHLKEQLTWPLMWPWEYGGPSHCLHDHSNIPTSWSILGPTRELGLVPNIMNDVIFFFPFKCWVLFFIFISNK